MFIAALFTISKAWTQPKCPLTDEWIKKTWYIYTVEYLSAMITHPEPDILECKVKWALGSITMNKATEGDGILAELFQILKDAVKVLHSIC